ncbi:thiamine pyrophosphate-binding protein [Methylovirgula ligni]|uniref:Acetolactate synthase-1/2/3 large subunit n=1 Tax=Methylovirgula ligni TaxID=569860 RepID=A0A3D9Z3U0_9HYPH|nr:thiamine pyrophosphate-binding protein [Methylovirgula ligni]QAY95745.1 thiamine pyrophosphate-binding protein [Methylovirgula ligni]REF88880.1 acetolactate synthase-1/2/3 large subunit [Methylovirgula ligni]
MTSRSAAQVLVDQLVGNGVTHAFCVPGESFLPVLDALRDSPIKVIICRQEGGAAMMAEAIGKATGRPGVCFVTRGPGATNATHGIHIAQQDSTPLLMFVGQVERGFREREAFQELDLRAVFGSMTKWTSEIDDARRVPELVSRAFYAATAGRPGPVVLGLPRDMLDEKINVVDAPPFAPVEIAPGEAEIAQFRNILLRAERPLFILGGSRWNEAAYQTIHDFAARFDIPVVTSYRRLPLFDPLHPSYAGDLGIGPNPKLVAAIKSADLIVALGGRLGDIPSQGYRLFDIPAPKMLVHVHPGVEELGRVYRPHLAINATPTRFCAALGALATPKHIAWRSLTETLHRDYLAWTDVATPQPGSVNLGAIMVWLREALPIDTILCNGAGNYAAWVHRFYRFRRFGTHVAPASGSMGYGVPAAVAMKLLRPERLVLSLAGDGDFLMNGQEFATAVQYNLPIVFIVCDNASYGTIRMHQEREFPGRVVGTDLRNPDFAAYACAFGGFGVTVERTEDFPEAFKAAREAGVPAIIHLKIDVDAVTPATTLTHIREQARARF